MRPIFATLFLGFTTLGAAAPRITSAGNAASLARFGTPGFGVAPGSLVSILGENLGPSDAVLSLAQPETNLGGVSVQLTSTSGTTDAQVVYASASRVTFVVPTTARSGEVLARITYENQTSSPRRLIIADRNFGIFTLNENGTGPADAYIASNVRRALTLLEPAMPGSSVILRGTGLGSDLNAGIEVYLGSIQAKVVSINRVECCAGIDEVTFEVPSGIEGCYVPIVGVIRGALDPRTFGQSIAVSNVVTIAVSSDGKTCSDPTGLTGEELTKLSRNDRVRSGGIVIGHNYADIDLAANPTGADKGMARFADAPAAQFLRSAGIHGLPAPGSCILGPYDQDADAVGINTTGAPIDAGSALRITSSRGVATLDKREDGFYRGSLPKGFVAAGAYTIDNGEGGGEVGPFNVTVTVPAPVTWTNKSKSYPTSRFSLTTIEWSGGQQGQFVSTFSLTRNNAAAVYGICTERAEAGQFTDPFYLPLVLPVDSREFGGLPSLIGFGSVYSTRYDAPGLDVALLTFVFLDAIYSE